MKEIVVRGRRCTIVVSAELRVHERSGTRDHYYDYAETRFEWIGVGMIVVDRWTSSPERSVFLFSTESRKDIALENSLGFDVVERPYIVDFHGYVDAHAEGYLRAVARCSKEQGRHIPHVQRPDMGDVDLARLGLVLDHDGQRHLPLGV